MPARCMVELVHTPSSEHCPAHPHVSALVGTACNVSVGHANSMYGGVDPHSKQRPLVCPFSRLSPRWYSVQRVSGPCQLTVWRCWSTLQAVTTGLPFLTSQPSLVQRATCQWAMPARCMAVLVHTPSSDHWSALSHVSALVGYAAAGPSSPSFLA